MRLKLVIAVAALQVLVLVYMAGQREWISRFGETLILRTAPVDPNDPMRGAYARLNYEISFAPAALCKGAPAEWVKLTDYNLTRRLRDEVVYASLSVDAGGLAELVSLTDTPPASGPSLRGRVESISQSGIQVRYGIEALFMKKVDALSLEREARESREGAPMDVNISVSSSGISVLKSYEWEPLGITLELQQRPRVIQIPPPQPSTAPADQRGIESLTVVLHNYGDKDIAIIDLPGDHSFRLVPNVRWGASNYSWVGEGRTYNLAAPTVDNIIVIKPGESLKRAINLTEPYWWILDRSTAEQQPFPLRNLKDQWSASFRIEYVPPPAEQLAGLPNGGLVDLRTVRSRAFTATRYVD